MNQLEPLPLCQILPQLNEIRDNIDHEQDFLALAAEELWQHCDYRKLPDVKLVLNLLRRLNERETDYADWERRLEMSYDIAKSELLNLRYGWELTQLSLLRLSELRQAAADLHRHCIAFLTAAARHLEILATGTTLTDDALAELDIVAWTEPTAAESAPPPAETPPHAETKKKKRRKPEYANPN